MCTCSKRFSSYDHEIDKKSDEELRFDEVHNIPNSKESFCLILLTGFNFTIHF